MDTILELFNQFSLYSKEYPAISGVFGLWLLGTGTVLLKSFPRKIWEIVVKNTTTTLTLVNTHQAYYRFLKWYESNNYSQNSRSIKMSNGRYGVNRATKGMGYGNHYFIFNRMPIKLNLAQLDAVGSDRERDQIKMTVIGRSHKTFNDIFKSIEEKHLDKDKIILHKYKNNWERISEQRKRSIDTIYLTKGVKEEILGFIDSFKSREKFNLKHGINHQTAIMLYGPPGTGKTSIIKAIAGHFDMNVYNLNASAMSNIEGAFASLPENALVIIEDIDSDNALHSRNTEKDVGNPGLIEFNFTSMSDVLNAIDGLHCSHGRILIATTNYFEKLDPALVRSGRFDLKIKIDYADNNVVEQFVKVFFPNNRLPKDFQIKEGVPSSTIQNFVLKNMNDFDGFLHPLKEQSNA